MKTMAIEIAAPTVNAKGSSRATITKGGAEYAWKTKEQTSTPWPPSNFNDPESNILDFCWTPTPEISEFVTTLEAEVVQIVAKDPKKFFGVELTPEEVKAKFISNLKTSSKGAPNFKTKGRFGSVKFWNEKHQPLKDPTVFPSDNRYQFVVKATALWLNNQNFGIAFDLQHVQVFADECPFKM